MECLVGFRGAMACAEGSMRWLRSFSFIHSSWSSRRCGARQKETVTTKAHALVAVGVGGRCAGRRSQMLGLVCMFVATRLARSL